MKTYKIIDSPRQRALRAGDVRYYTGMPCTNGHYAERYTKDTHCVECDRQRSKLRECHKLEKVKAYRKAYRKTHRTQMNETARRRKAVVRNEGI